ncbi:hypothetical protein CIB84_010816 [Bambusicola thoracicus]|uniref:Uncharacterized protein n=1 Tax=Bambusicola thoracicus TaxID=9083 RepID=A0A2P4SMX9_BAMTH|nr:hypothetical protein CIB84_010816 [Bambusicola thoracicus]
MRRRRIAAPLGKRAVPSSAAPDRCRPSARRARRKRSSVARSPGTPEAPGGEKRSRVPGDLPRAPCPRPAPLRSSLTCSRRCPRSGRGTPIAHAGTAAPSPLLPLRPSPGRGRRVTAGTPRAAPLLLRSAPAPSRSARRWLSSALHRRTGREAEGGAGAAPFTLAPSVPLTHSSPAPCRPRLPLAPPARSRGSANSPLAARAVAQPNLQAPPHGVPAASLPRRGSREGTAGRFGVGWAAGGEQQVGGGKEHRSPSAAVGPEPSFSGAPLRAPAAPPPRFKSLDAAARWR